MQISKQQFYKIGLEILFILGGITANQRVFAQIVPDSTLGTESSIVNQINNLKDRIDGGAARGTNLFHSFQEFNIDANKSVYFANPTGIENILTRVTGDNVSNILGTLGVEGTANLFLINPNGIFFGKDAVLDIRGSFTATTADSIQLGKNGLFSATNPQDSNLLSVQPGALFTNALRNQQAEIKNEGNLRVDNGKNITLFGANVINTGTLTAPGGTVQITGAENLKVRGNIDTNTLLIDTKNLTIGEDDQVTIDKTTLDGLSGNTNLIFESADDVTINPLSDNSLNFANGISKIIFTTDDDGNGIGNFIMNSENTISTNGRSIEIKGVELTIGSINTGSQMNGGNITLTANNGNIYTQNLTSESYSDLAPGGNGGNITLTATNGSIYTQNLTSRSLLFIANIPPENPESDLSSMGKIEENSEKITLTAIGGEFITNIPSENPSLDLSSMGGIVGNAGKITLTAIGGDISTNSIDSYSETNLSTTANGDAITLPTINGGAITITAINGNITTQSLDSHSSSQTGVTGNGGDITLSSNRGNISIENLESSSSSGSGTAGNGGAINIITTDGDITVNDLVSNSISELGASGHGGKIVLTTNSGNISTQNLESYSISGSEPAKNAGAITLTTENGNISTLSLNPISYSKSGIAGNGGEIKLTANNGDISTQSLNPASISGSGTAGNAAGITLITRNGNISTESLNSFSYSESGMAGNGGEIKLTANNGDISTQSLNSFSYSTSSTTGNGGGIILTTANGNIKGIRDDNSQKFPIFSSFSISEAGNSGEGGNVKLEAKNEITDLGILTLSSSSKSGDIAIQGFGDLSIRNSSIITSKQVSVDTLFFGEITLDDDGIGQSGNVIASSNGNLTFQNSRIESDTKSGDRAGNVTISAPGIVILNKSQITSSTSSKGKAGNIQINGNNLTLTDTSEISVSTTGDGNAGDITLNTPTLSVVNGSKILATTVGKGNGGTITINAPNTVDIGTGVQNFAPILSVETSGAGKAGDIIINTPNLTVFDTARITATATTKVNSTESGGSITLNASKINLAGIVGIFAETQGQAPAGTLQLNPYQNQPDLDITLFPNSTISASTSASGQGGDLIITAPENINITGQGKLSVESTGVGGAGNIFITTKNLNITDGVKISASTINSGKGGNINVNSNTLKANNGAQFLTITSGIAKAGNINLIVKDNITLDGAKTGLFANTEKGSTGNSGNITIDPEIFIIKNGAGIGVDSQGSGQGGNISIQAGTLNLDKNAFINAASASSQGGEVTLQIKNLLLMDNNSNITATAGTDKAGGNGGNINIYAPFIISLSNTNNDITANAYQGNGGNININTNQIFGLKFRPELTPDNDITASSQFGVSGNVEITTPGVDPTSGLTNLPTSFVDAESLNKDVCALKDDKIAGGSSFIITGKGGLPADTHELISNSSAFIEWEKISEAVTQVPHSPVKVTQKSINHHQKIQQAQGWIITPDGKVILTADSQNVTLQTDKNNLVNCK